MSSSRARTDGMPDHVPANFSEAIAYLGAKDKLDVDDMKLMVLLETSGEPLYELLAALAPEGEARDLLLANGREETAHAHRIKRAIEIQTGAPYAIPDLADNPYATPPSIAELSAELLAGVAAGESSGDLMYQRYADSEPNPEIAELLRQNGVEETRHGKRVSRVAEIIAANA